MRDQGTPAVIVKVVSKSTRRIDEGEKNEEYLTIPSLQPYIIRGQDKTELNI